MRKLSLLLLVFISIVVLNACKTTEKEVQQGVTDTEILVGNCASQSGGMESVGIPFNAGIKAYFDMVNEKGGIDGRKIKFINKDDESSPVKAKACIDEMVEDEEVFAIVGHFGSGQVGATLEDLKEKGLPVVYFASGLATLYNENATGENRGIYPVQPILVMEGRLMVARAVKETNAKKIGVIYTSDEAGTDMITGIRNQVQKLGSGYSLVEAQATVGGTNFAAPVTTIMNANVDVIIIASIQATFPPLVKELAKQGNTKPAFTTYNNAAVSAINDVKADLIVNDTPKFDIYANAWVDTSDVAALTLFATEIVKSSGKQEYAANAFSTAGWIAGHFFVEGLRNHTAGADLTWDSYMTALESKPIKNPFGGEISFANGKRLGTEEMSLLKIAKNDKNEWIWGPHKPIANIEEILK